MDNPSPNSAIKGTTTLVKSHQSCHLITILHNGIRRNISTRNTVSFETLPRNEIKITTYPQVDFSQSSSLFFRSLVVDHFHISICYGGELTVFNHYPDEEKHYFGKLAASPLTFIGTHIPGTSVTIAISTFLKRPSLGLSQHTCKGFEEDTVISVATMVYSDSKTIDGDFTKYNEQRVVYTLSTHRLRKSRNLMDRDSEVLTPLSEDFCAMGHELIWLPAGAPFRKVQPIVESTPKMSASVFSDPATKISTAKFAHAPYPRTNSKPIATSTRTPTDRRSVKKN